MHRTTLGLLLALPLAAQYSFTDIAHTGDGSNLEFRTVPTVVLASNGMVAFESDRDSIRSIHAGTGGPLTTIAESDSLVSALQLFAVNSRGMALFGAAESLHHGALYTSDGASLTTIPVYPGEAALSGDINDEGVIAYASVQTIRIFAGGVLRTVDTDPVALAFCVGQLNQLGDLAFISRGQVKIDRQGELMLVATTGRVGDESLGGSCPSMNDDGVIALNGGFMTNGVFRPVLFRFDGRERSIIIDGEATDYVNINNSGAVAYATVAGIDSEVDGLYVIKGSEPQKVVALGDRLFGSEVEYLWTTGGRPGRYFNDNGQVAFFYRLANGVEGIALATPDAIRRTRRR